MDQVPLTRARKHLMRKKLFIGMFLVAIAGIVAGEYLFNHSGAQDAPKKTEPDKKKTEGNLFDILKKDLDAKKDAVDNLPPLQFPAPVQLPAVDAKDQIPPPSAPKPEVAVPTPPKVNDAKAPLPLVPGPGSTPQVAPPLIINQAPMPPAVPDKPQTVEPKESPPLAPLDWTGFDSIPPLSKPKADGPSPLPPPAPVPPPLDKPDESRWSPMGPKEPAARPLSPTGPKEPAARPLSPMQPIVDQVAKLKNCPWRLQVELVDGRTVVTAMVNKKHEFKIACEKLDLQTGNGTLKAFGKVRISSDMMNGACEQLEIPLMEDRLVLEGGAEVRISNGADISSWEAAAFELNSHSLNLRISELRSGNVVQAGWNVPPPSLPNSIAMNGNYPATNAPGSPASRFRIGEAPLTGPWTGYGILRRTKELHNGRPVWCLEGRDGRRFERFVAREGGKLDAYEGQTMSVYLHSDKVMSYATHMALP
jgi:hypothetical protein